MSKGSASPPQPHPRKLDIIEAAVACFLKQGFHQTGVRDIARRAGISLGNLYNHFSAKEDVLVEIARIESAELAPFLRLLSKTEDPETTLRQFVRRYSAYMSRPENALLSLEIVAEAARNPRIGALFMENRARLVSALSGLIAAGAAEDQFQHHAVSEETAHLVLDTIEGQGLRNALWKNIGSGQVRTLEQYVIAALYRQ